MFRNLKFVLWFSLCIGFLACAPEDERTDEQVQLYREIDWEDLVPAGSSVTDLLDKYDITNLSDTDPKAIKILNELREAWDKSPVVTELDQEQVKIPGFMVPLEFDDDSIVRFLLVPYFGACIHVPPPPSNQIVLVETSGLGTEMENLYDAVWVSGTLSIERTTSEMGSAGYRLDAEEIALYDGLGFLN